MTQSTISQQNNAFNSYLATSVFCIASYKVSNISVVLYPVTRLDSKRSNTFRDGATGQVGQVFT